MRDPKCFAHRKFCNDPKYVCAKLHGCQTISYGSYFHGNPGKKIQHVEIFTRGALPYQSRWSMELCLPVSFFIRDPARLAEPAGAADEYGPLCHLWGSLDSDMSNIPSAVYTLEQTLLPHPDTSPSRHTRDVIRG